MENDEIIFLELGGVHACQLGGEEEVELVVGIMLYGPAQGGDVGVRGGGQEGYLLATIDDLDGYRATVVAGGELVGVGREDEGIALEAGFLGVEGEGKGSGIVVALIAEGLRGELAVALADGESAAAVRQAGGAHRHLDGEAVAHIGDAVVAHCGDGGVAPGGRVAEGDGIEGHCQRGGHGGGVLSLVVDAVATEHHSRQVTSGVALLDVGEGRRDIGPADIHAIVHALGIGVAHHVEVLLQLVQDRCPSLVAEGVAVGSDRLRHIVGHHQDRPFAVVHLSAHQWGQQQERQQRHHREAEHGEEDAHPAGPVVRRACPVPFAVKAVEGKGIHAPCQEAEQQEIPRKISQQLHSKRLSIQTAKIHIFSQSAKN